MLLKPNDHILFYGDSITDAGRGQTVNNPEKLGSGYAAIVAALLKSRYPEMNFRFTNRGISGNRIYDLADRLERDVIDERPTLVSILIGINDTWRRFDSNTPSPISEFKETYAALLTRLRESLGCRILLLEPFLLPVPEDRRAWRIDLDPRIQAIRELAATFKTGYLALDGIFAEACSRMPAEYWLPDGVHPSLAGHGLIAQRWVKYVTRS